jgi:hypothetical protein
MFNIDATAVMYNLRDQPMLNHQRGTRNTELINQSTNHQITYTCNHQNDRLPFRQPA